MKCSPASQNERVGLGKSVFNRHWAPRAASCRSLCWNHPNNCPRLLNVIVSWLTIPFPRNNRAYKGSRRATGKCGGGAQAENNTGWGWKECLWRDLPSLDVENDSGGQESRKVLPGWVHHEAREEEELSRAWVHPGGFANNPGSGASEE